MDEFPRVEKWTLDDGRRAERRVTENVSPTGEGERVIELHMEDERPLRIQQRVVEKRKPFIYEREIHTLDKSGKVVEKKVESVEPRTQMQTVEHIATAQNVSAQSVEDDCDCHVTKEEMIETIIAAMKAANGTDEPTKLKSLGLAEEIEKRTTATVEDGDDIKTKAAIGVIIVEIILLGYMFFMM